MNELTQPKATGFSLNPLNLTEAMPTGRKFQNLIGKKFGYLTVIRFIGQNNSRNSIWECTCDCGITLNLLSTRLKNGNTRSCGCYRSKLTSERNYKHGLSKTDEHSIWLGMKSRCYNSKLKAYKNYGERGIRVSKEWLESFTKFINDMGERPTKRHSIDRINNDANYTKENCRWATRSEQNSNQRIRKTNKSGVSGVCFDPEQKKWRARANINHKRIHLDRFNNIFDAAAAIFSFKIKCKKGLL